MASTHRQHVLTVAVLPAAVVPSVHAAETPADTRLRLQSHFQSSLVLQRDRPIDVWGWSRPGDMELTSRTGEHS